MVRWMIVAALALAGLAIPVPAHDEPSIASTVENLLAVDHPKDLRRVIVVADNCTDDTAQRARSAGATVLERVDAERRGKGYALEQRPWSGAQCT